MPRRSSAARRQAAAHTAPAHGTRLRTVRPDGTPVYRYEQRAGTPPVSVLRFDPDDDHAGLGPDHRHAHDFLVLVYIEGDDVVLRLDGVEQILPTGAVYAIPPGQVLGVGSIEALNRCRAWSVFFMPEAVLTAAAAGSALRWADDPLLAPFAPGRSPTDPARAMVVPPAQRPRWSAWLAELADELAAPERIGARQAAVALLGRLLVETARLANAEGVTPAADPLLGRVFAVIEDRYTESISTRDVAAALGYTTGHLTTLVRERTGRTVLDWITERRMAEVRRLLTETDLPLRRIAADTGHRDAEYLSRRFRERYGVTPLAWRRLNRSAEPVP